MEGKTQEIPRSIPPEACNAFNAEAQQEGLSTGLGSGPG